MSDDSLDLDSDADLAAFLDEALAEPTPLASLADLAASEPDPQRAFGFMALDHLIKSRLAEPAEPSAQLVVSDDEETVIDVGLDETPPEPESEANIDEPEGSKEPKTLDFGALIAGLPKPGNTEFCGALDRLLLILTSQHESIVEETLKAIAKTTGASVGVLRSSFKRVMKARKAELRSAPSKEDSAEDSLERGDHVEVSEHLLANELKGAEFGFGQIHVYDEATGVWIAKKPAEVHAVIRGYAGRAVVGRRGSGLRLNHGDLNGIRHCTEEALEHHGQYFEQAPIGFAFANGFVRIEQDGTIVVDPHGPENKARWRYDFDFDRSLSCPAFKSFLLELVKNDSPSEKRAKLQLVLEHAGASLLGQAWRGGLALILHGYGNDGKSTLVTCLKDCFPSGSVTAIAPHDFGQEYSRAALAGSLYNVVGELSDKELRDSESIKNVITGRDLVQGRHPYERPFAFTPRAGHIIVANSLPPVSDQSRGFWRRWAVVPFTRSFTSSEEDRDIEKKLASEQQAIVVTLVEAAAQWVARGYQFEIPPSVQTASAAWRDGADAVSTWVANGVDLTSGEGITGAHAFEAFDRWRERNRFASLSSRTFGERLKSIVRGLAREGRLPADAPRGRIGTFERQGCRESDGKVFYPLAIKQIASDVFSGDLDLLG